jgi:redox-sensitive bicupin YhaK (pirin superfamily)
VSGPVSSADAAPRPSAADQTGDEPGVIEILDSRETTVGRLRVRRALPRRAHRTVGAWCFADHMGPADVTEEQGVDIGPHPHMGLQTVTWLVAGEVLHRDSLGSEQVVRAGQLNLMTAGRGVAHAEEATGRYRGSLHGIQLWVAQPDRTRMGEAAFEHHASLPGVDLDNGEAVVIVGDFAGVVSPARRDTDHFGADLTLGGPATLPLRADSEHALVVLSGAVELEGRPVEPGQLAFLGPGRSDVGLRAVGGQARVLLLGGVPFPEPVFMWWNFVARSATEVDEAYRQWQAGDGDGGGEGDEGGRFGAVASRLARIPAPPPAWHSRPTG